MKRQENELINKDRPRMTRRGIGDGIIYSRDVVSRISISPTQEFFSSSIQYRILFSLELFQSFQVHSFATSPLSIH